MCMTGLTLDDGLNFRWSGHGFSSTFKRACIVHERLCGFTQTRGNDINNSV